MQIDFEDAKFLMLAGITAQVKWRIPEDVQITQAGRCDNLTVPLYEDRLEWFAEHDALPDPSIPPRFGQEVITLAKFSDADGHVVHMGYGLRTNVLAVRID